MPGRGRERGPWDVCSQARYGQLEGAAGDGKKCLFCIGRPLRGSSGGDAVEEVFDVGRRDRDWQDGGMNSEGGRGECYSLFQIPSFRN